MRPSIFIGIPSYQPDDRFLVSLLVFLEEIKNHYDVQVYEVKGKQLVDAQNDIAEKFLSTNYAFLLLLEDDHWGHSRKMLQGLLKADTEVCAINYYSRHQPHYTCLMRELAYTHVDQRFGHLDYTSGYHKCDLMGYGMMLIRRSVFSKLEKPYFRLNRDGGKDCYATDIDFCDRLKSCGVDLIGCFDYILNHREITPENVMQKRIEGFEDIRKQRNEELKKKGLLV